MTDNKSRTQIVEEINKKAGELARLEGERKGYEDKIRNMESEVKLWEKDAAQEFKDERDTKTKMYAMYEAQNQSRWVAIVKAIPIVGNWLYKRFSPSNKKLEALEEKAKAHEAKGFANRRGENMAIGELKTAKEKLEAHKKTLENKQSELGGLQTELHEHDKQSLKEVHAFINRDNLDGLSPAQVTSLTNLHNEWKVMEKNEGEVGKCREKIDRLDRELERLSENQSLSREKMQNESTRIVGERRAAYGKLDRLEQSVIQSKEKLLNAWELSKYQGTSKQAEQFSTGTPGLDTHTGQPIGSPGWEQRGVYSQQELAAAQDQEDLRTDYEERLGG